MEQMLRISNGIHSLPARLLKVGEVEGKNNPPPGDFEDDVRSSSEVDVHMGAAQAIPLLLLVVLPPITEVPILECKPQFLTGAQVELVEDVL